MAWRKAPADAQPAQVDVDLLDYGPIRGARPELYLPFTLTSTASMVVDDRGVSRIRTFNISADQLWQSARTADNYTPKETADDRWSRTPLPTTGSCAGLGPGGACDTQRLCYLDSGRAEGPTWDCTATYTVPDPRLVAVVDSTTSAPACGSQNVTATCIPTLRRHRLTTDLAWHYEYIADFEIAGSSTRPVADNSLYGGPEGLTGIASIGVGSARFALTHKDPSIVELPNGGGWLMLLARTRSWETILSDSCAGAAGQLGSSPTNSMGDIVAWWSADPSFDDGVATVLGPFFMVDSIHALPGLELRFWLGVPTGAIVEEAGADYLYLYYQVEPPLEAAGFTAPAPLSVLRPDAYDPGLSYRNWSLALAGYAHTGSATRVYKRGLAVKRIAVAELIAFLSYGSTDEPAWTSSDTAPGELLGQVRVWACDTGAIGPYPFVVPFDTAFGASVEDGPVSADPSAVATSTGLNLYFSTLEPRRGSGLPTDPRHGYGIWRCVAVPDSTAGTPDLVYEQKDGQGRVYSTISVAPKFGVDFVLCVAPLGGGAYPRDMVAPAPSSGFYLDPDVVQDPSDGSWRVYVGQERESLTLFLGDPADGTTPWQDAWCPSQGADAQGANARAAPADADMEAVYRLLPWLRIPAEPVESGPPCGCGQQD